jgi:hypothetical protein
MEPELIDALCPSEELLSVAANHVSDGHLLCADVSAMVFPRSTHAPTEEMISAVSLKLRSIVCGIENILRDTNNEAKDAEAISWRLLARSGFLREPALIDFVLARYAEDRLSARLAISREIDLVDQLPARLLASAEPVLASAAQILLASNSMLKNPSRRLHYEMNAELLHQTCWRIAASLQVEMGQKDETVIANARKLLANHDENQSVNTAARKAVHFLEGKHQEDCANPAKAGLALFVALIASKTGLEQDHIMQLIAGPNSAALAVMLRVIDLHRDAAMAVICLFKGFELTPREISLFDNYYDVLDIDTARKAVEKWSLSRAQFLAFPSLNESQL